MQLDDEETLAKLDALRREAYSRNGSESAFAALRELERSLAREPQRAPEREAEREQPPAKSAVKEAVPQPNSRKRAPSWRRVFALTLAALGVAAIGFSLGRAPSAPTPTVEAAAVGESQHGVATLALLEASQQPSDIPPFSLGSDITASTVHVLTAAGAPGVTVYGARTHEKLVCLIAVTTDLHSADTCATEHQFVTDGIRLRITTDAIVKNDAGSSDFAFYQYFWSSDGAISGSSNEYLFPAAPHN